MLQNSHNRGPAGSSARTHAPRTMSAGRAGFTLVEMIVVIAIIGILAGLAIPAMMNARVKMIEAKVVVEIKQLESGINAFKAKYGTEPPSQFTIYFDSTGWSSDPQAMATVRAIWPQFDFNMTGGAGTAYPAFWANTPIVQTKNGNPCVFIDAPECLLFFLGGVIPIAGPNQVPTGFAKNPATPFAPMSGTANANREGPFFELTDISRIKDADGDGMNEWYDPIPNQTAPYLYLSSYQGSGYRWQTELGWSVPGGPALPTDVYRVSNSLGTNPPTSPTATYPGTPPDSRSLPAQKPQSFQIISPGYDGLYGSGGVFNPNLNNSGLVDPTGAPDLVAYDNITNFNGGRLKP